MRLASLPRIGLLGFCSFALITGGAWARPVGQVQRLVEPEVEAPLVGDADGPITTMQKALQDTVWIADWNFDVGFSGCTQSGWIHVDNRIKNDGVLYWHIETGFTTATGMAGNSLAVGHHGNVCCADADGYDNDWYQGIRIPYIDVGGSGTPTLSLDYIVDSEDGFDFLQIETDSLCSSYTRVNFDTRPWEGAASYRVVEVEDSGLHLNGEVGVSLLEYGPGTHCLYIAFIADGGFSPCDGLQPTTVGEGLVVDNIVVSDGSGTRSEDFEDGDLDFGTALNIAESVPFGTWARVYSHVTDNDRCTENTTCSWLWTDHTTPTIANNPSMAFGPGEFVVKNWLDDIVISPWVSLASTSAASGTVLTFRRFPGNFFSNGRIMQNWSVRGRNASCTTGWGHTLDWNSLSFFGWQSLRFDMTSFVDPTSTELQIRFRTSDSQWLAGASPPVQFNPGPGPYVDRIRIGRRTLSGPVIHEGIDSRSQGQDAFASEINPLVTPAGQHFRPTTDRFGACAFSQGTELGINGTSPNLITGDSLNIVVRGLRPVPGGDVVSSVVFHGAVVAGPHQGKAVPTTMATAPPPWAVGGNGFFAFAADTVRSATGAAVSDNYFADLDDFYFRGGDVLQYLWTATDAAGGFSSAPAGLTAPPVSIAQAQAATGGLFEVNFLPVTNWDPAYRAAILADDYGDIAPTAAQIANSEQKNCILYVQNIASRRRSGMSNRTAFMWSLDRLGYGPTASDPHGHYDVYDHQGMGNTNNQLGSRATVQQCQGYNLIVYDNGDGTPGRPLLPDGVNLDSEKIDQATWFRNWLAQAAVSEAGFATLWMLGSNTVQEKRSDPLITTDMGTSFSFGQVGFGLYTAVDGQSSFTFDTGSGSVPVDFNSTLYYLDSGCPVFESFDVVAASGTAVRTHRYIYPPSGALSGGAIVMNRNNAGNWNTIQQTHPWFDIRDTDGVPDATAPEVVLLGQILGAVLPLPCQHSPDPATQVGDGDEIDAPPQTLLHPNVPNPFNPITEIRFDLAESGRVSLRIYDVAGRLVRTLIDKDMAAGRSRTVVWNGLDDQNTKVASGVYFYRLDAADKSLTRKMVIMK